MSPLRHLLLSAALFPLRAIVCAIGWFSYWMEVAADWCVGARGATEYVRVGACRRCGRCCKCLGMELPARLASEPEARPPASALAQPWRAGVAGGPERFVGRDLLLRIVHAWHDHVMNLEALGETERLLVYRCRYYREDVDGHCTIYPFRHRLCRFFPRQRLYGHPALDPDCGFRFVRRDVLFKRRAHAQEHRTSFDDVVRKIECHRDGLDHPPLAK